MLRVVNAELHNISRDEDFHDAYCQGERELEYKCTFEGVPVFVWTGNDDD